MWEQRQQVSGCEQPRFCAAAARVGRRAGSWRYHGHQLLREPCQPEAPVCALKTHELKRCRPETSDECQSARTEHANHAIPLAAPFLVLSSSGPGEAMQCKPCAGFDNGTSLVCEVTPRGEQRGNARPGGLCALCRHCCNVQKATLPEKGRGHAVLCKMRRTRRRAPPCRAAPTAANRPSSAARACGCASKPPAVHCARPSITWHRRICTTSQSGGVCHACPLHTLSWK